MYDDDEEDEDEGATGIAGVWCRRRCVPTHPPTRHFYICLAAREKATGKRSGHALYRESSET